MTSQPSPTNLSDELDRILSEMIGLIFDTDTDEFTDGTKQRYENAKAAITAAYAEAIKRAKPEKHETRVYDQSDEEFENAAGFNAAIDTFTANLQKEGLL